MTTPTPDLPSISTGGELPSFGRYVAELGAVEGVTFWPRVAARIIDTILHYLIAIFTGRLFGVMIAIATGGRPDPYLLAKMEADWDPTIYRGVLGAITFHTVMEGMHGSTPGKLALSMVVIQEDGSPCRTRAAFIRSLAYFVEALFFGLIGYAAMKGNPAQQRHGDEWAHTIVCKRSRVQPQNLRGGGRLVVALLLASMADSALILIGLLLKLKG